MNILSKYSFKSAPIVGRLGKKSNRGGIVVPYSWMNNSIIVNWNKIFITITLFITISFYNRYSRAFRILYTFPENFPKSQEIRNFTHFPGKLQSQGFEKPWLGAFESSISLRLREVQIDIFSWAPSIRIFRKFYFLTLTWSSNRHL